MRGARLLDDLRQDLRIALRGLSRQRAFTLAAILTLGIGIGGNVAMYGVLQSSIFASLPYPSPDRLLTGRSTMNDGARLGPMLSGFDFMDYREQSRTLERVAAIAPFPQRVTVQGAGEAERVDGVQVTPGFFEVLGVVPVAGRTFTAQEGEPGAERVAVLSYGYWVSRFGSDPSVVGRTLSIGGGPRTVVGVMPPEARFMVDADMWLPIIRGQGMAGSRGAHNLLMVARVAAGQTLESAQMELDAISARLAEAYPDTNSGKGILLTPARDMLVENYRSTLALLIGAVFLLLIVACTNVAGLLLARGSARTPEMSVRSVMGAGRGRLVRQLVTENGVLALVAGLVGVGFATWGARAIRSFVSMDRLGAVEQGSSLEALGYALGLSLLTVLLFGLVPALRLAGISVAGALRGAGRIAGSRASARWRSGLVVAQVALTTVLLSVAGLLGRSLQALTTADLGFNETSLLTAELELPPESYTSEERIAFFEQLRTRAAALPGVEDVTLASQLPLRDPGNNWGIGLPGALGSSEGTSLLAHQRITFPGYFQTMGAQLLSGRDLSDADRGASPSAVVISRATAEQLFGTEDPVGRIVEVQGSGSGPDRAHQVVGVVADMVMDWTAWGTPPAMYFAFHDRAPNRMRIALRFQGDAAAAGGGLRELVRSMDPSLPVDGVETMASIIDRGTRDQQSLALLVGLFALLALLLAGVGLYGVLAWQVTRRVREIGIRIALGASVGTVSNSVLKGGWQLVIIGLLVGIPGALLAGRLVQEFLFGVGIFDPITLVAVSGFLMLVASAACLLPARRAARIDPAEAFRTE